MTTPETATVEVTQADHDAAQEYMRLFPDLRLPEAFARHRTRANDEPPKREYDANENPFSRRRLYEENQRLKAQLATRQDGLREALAHEERKAVLQNKRVNDAIQTALERGELTVTGNGYLAALSDSSTREESGAALDQLQHLGQAYDAGDALREENRRLREYIAASANNVNIVGSAYDDAITALDRLVAETKSNARAALSASPEGEG